MQKDFFVMLRTQSGSALPMVDEDGEVVFFDSADNARRDARQSVLGEYFGFEIFELGTGA